MAKLKKYKTFFELKNSVDISSYSEHQLDILAADLDIFYKKISSSVKKSNTFDANVKVQ